MISSKKVLTNVFRNQLREKKTSILNKANDNSLNEAISEKMGAGIPDIVKKSINR